MQCQIGRNAKVSLFALIFAILISCQATRCARAEIVIENVQLGIDNNFCVGRWSPISFDVVSSNQTTQILTPQIRTSDPDGHGVVQRLAEIEVGSKPVHVEAVFRSGRIEASIFIELRENQNLVAEEVLRCDRYGKFNCMKQDGQIWVVDGEQPSFSEAARRLGSATGSEIVVVEASWLKQNVSDARALESAKLIVLHPETTVSQVTAKTIREWAQRGGNLLVCVNENPDTLAESPLAAWLPIMPEGVTQARNLDGLLQLVRGKEPIRFLGSTPVTHYSLSDGAVLASVLGTPIVVRSSFGKGQITMSGVRLDRSPLSGWALGPELAMELAGLDSTLISGLQEQATTSNNEDSFNPTGISDIQTQLVQVLDIYEDVPRPSYWVVIARVLVMILLIGPADYYLLNRVFNRPQLTWLTLPVILILITLWSISSASAVNSGKLQGGQFEIIDVNVELNQISGHALMNFYSPQTQRVNVRASVPETVLPSGTSAAMFSQTSWVDRPEESYRGMYRSGELEKQKPAYSISADNQAIEDLPVRIWSTNGASATWEAEVEPGSVIESTLLDKGKGRLEGAITYLGPYELSEWFVAYRDFVYFPKTSSGASQSPLRAGDIFDTGEARSNLLRNVLRGLTHASIFEEGDSKKDFRTIVQRTDYDPLSRDSYKILRTMSFHEAVEGSKYTSLSNHTLNHLDLSKHLSLRRAVLFGRIKSSVTEFQLNGEPIPLNQQDTIIRIIVPVDYQEADVNAPPDPRLLRIN